MDNITAKKQEMAKEEKKLLLQTLEKNLRTILKEKDLKIDVLSKKSKIPIATINSYINGAEAERKMPSIINVKKIAKALNTSIDELVYSDKDTETVYIPQPSAEIILKNLCISIMQANLIITENENEVSFITKNPYIKLFMSEVKELLKGSNNENNIIEQIEKASNRFSDLKVYNGNIVDNTTYRHYCRQEFIYHGTINGEKTEENLTPITPNDYEKYEDDIVYQEIDRREKIWDEKYAKGA